MGYQTIELTIFSLLALKAGVIALRTFLHSSSIKTINILPIPYWYTEKPYTEIVNFIMPLKLRIGEMGDKT